MRALKKISYYLYCMDTGPIKILKIASFAGTNTSELVMSRERQLMNLLNLLALLHSVPEIIGFLRVLLVHSIVDGRCDVVRENIIQSRMRLSSHRRRV